MGEWGKPDSEPFTMESHPMSITIFMIGTAVTSWDPQKDSYRLNLVVTK